jgi:hypothetical protein
MIARRSASLPATVAKLCLSFPECEEFLSHGSPNFRVRKGKVFATFVINHHGDGRIALWLPSDTATQDHLVRSEPKHFFVPPYLGPRGWIGVRLDKGLSWRRIAALVQDAFRRIAPARLGSKLGRPPEIAAPRTGLTLAELDPMHSSRAMSLRKTLGAICLAFPDVSEGEQFGYPVWRAGKKTFVQFYHANNGFVASFWVGIDKQAMMTLDPRFHVPPFSGANGWIGLTLADKKPNTQELERLAEASYRHFAQTKMLQALDGALQKQR